MGGVHPSENKLSCAKPIEVLPLPDVVTIPLAQHIGAPAVAKVAKGDRVLTGQLIAEAGSFMSANIHSPISGTVTAVDMVVNGQGLRQMMITIKREGDDWAEGIDRSDALVKVCPFSAQEIIAKIKDAGIVGMGGATFPTHVKLSIPPGKKAESLIINGVECEPYLTSDHRTMLEHGEELLVGVTILMKAIAVEKAYIGIENNKPDAIAHLTKIAAGYKGIEVVPLKVMYPQGGEKQLIAAVTGRQVPPPPALPIDVGAVVCNASTTVAVYQAVLKNKPLIERVVTVTGKSVKEPKNLLTRMGTPISALLEAAGGLPADAGKVINGGPMMGRAMVDLSSPVTKGCSGITVLGGAEAQRDRLLELEHAHTLLIPDERERRQYRHAEPRRDHGEDRPVIRRRDLDARRVRREKRLDILIRAREERLAQQPLQRDGVPLPRKVRRHDGHERRVRQRLKIKALRARLVHEGELDAPARERGLQLFAAHEHVQLDLRVLGAEGTQQLRQARARNARKTADAQRALARVALLGGLLQEGVARADHVLNIGQQLPARVRQADALTVTLEQRTADFRLQFVDQMCHCGLGIAQLRRRFTEAAAIDRRQQGAKFTVVHTLPPYLHFASPSYHEFVSISHKTTEKE